jgi:hypothetical protein
MTVIRLTCFLAGLFLLTRCQSQITLPKNVDEAILYFQQKWTNAELNSFKNKSEKDAVTDLHFGTGQWIRNSWVYGNRDTALTNYFHSLGVYHPDDISAIILTSLHRSLNKKDIELNLQIEHHKAYWKVITECKEKQKAIAVSNYSKFIIGDTILIRMPVAFEDNVRNAFMYDCPTTDWTFNENKDLLLRGIITNKHFINNKSNVFFTIRIIYMNRKDTTILMTEAKPGDERDFSLAGLTIQ